MLSKKIQGNCVCHEINQKIKGTSGDVGEYFVVDILNNKNAIIIKVMIYIVGQQLMIASGKLFFKDPVSVDLANPNFINDVNYHIRQITYQHKYHKIKHKT